MFIPEYNKPEEPGIALGFDNTVALYHVVEPADTFEDAALAVFGLLKEAEARYPGWPRVLYVDVNGHQGEIHGFDGDFFEFQQEFLLQAMGPFLTALHLPLTGGLVNPDPQRSDLPDALQVGDPTLGDGQAGAPPTA